MCGGSDSAPTPAVDSTYTPPNLRDNYTKFRETGTVPYSYYGAGAPTKADELARVKAAYSGAFAPAPPANAPTQPQNPFALLIQSLMGRFRGPQGANGTSMPLPNPFQRPQR